MSTNSIQNITAELFDIINQTQSNVLANSAIARISALSSFILNSNELENEKSTLLPLLNNVQALGSTEDTRKVMIACLRKCPDEMICSVLGLDIWAKNELTKGQPEIRKAIFLILKCFKKNEEHLILDSFNLSTLPQNVFKFLTQLVYLDISSNSLSELPSDLACLTNLRTLNCSYNQIKYLSSVQIGQLSELLYLDCSHNQLVYLPGAQLGLLKKLKSLNCNTNRLFEVPPQVCELTNLEKLNCHNNRISSLPSQIGQLNKLKVLDCSFNKIVLLPASICLLTNLEDLNCMHNQLITLTPQLNLLTNLLSLQCGGNELTYIPSTIGQLIKLKQLSFTGNLIHTVPDELYNLPNLERFSCARNYLTSLPTSLLSNSNPQLNSHGDLVWLPTVNAHNTTTAIHLQTSQVLQNPQSTVNTNDPLDVFITASNDSTFKNFNLEWLKSSGHDELYANTLQWLNSLKSTLEFTNQNTRPFFASRVLGILLFAKNNPRYFDTFKAFLIGALESCVDRAASPINYLEFQKLILESKDKSVGNFITLMKSGFALELLNQFSKNFMKSHPQADEVEVYLGFQTMLKDVLNLPTLKSMNFFVYSAIKKEDLNNAIAFVENAWQDLTKLTEYFIEQEVWVEKLKNDYRKEFEEFLEPVNIKLDELETNKEKLISEEYNEQIKALSHKYGILEKEWVYNKTIELLKTQLSKMEA